MPQNLPKHEVKRSDWKTWLVGMFANLRNASLGYLIFLADWLLTMVAFAVKIVIFFLIAMYLQGPLGSQLGPYGDSYVTFMVVGVALDSYLNLTITSFHESMLQGYWTSSFELYVVHPVGISSYFTGTLLWRLVTGTLLLVMYVAIGQWVFHLPILSAGLLSVSLVLLLGIASVIGIGLISASTFALLDCKSWGGTPVEWAVRLLVSVFSGVYFPITVLPRGLRTVGYFLPQTYIYDAARRLVGGGQALGSPVVLTDLLAMALFTLVLVPVGVWMFRVSLRVAEGDGAMSRWT